MDVLTKFYGFDWMLFVFLVIHLWMLGQKIRAAFLVGFAGSLFGVGLGIVIGSIATTSMNFVFGILQLRAYFKWKQMEEKDT